MKDVLRIGDKVKFTVKSSGKVMTDVITELDGNRCIGTAYNLSTEYNRGGLKKV